MGILRAPAPSPSTACLVLAALVTVLASVPSSTLTAVLIAISVGLLVVELDRSGRHVALRVVSLAAHLLPVRIRGDFEAEWCDHVLSAGEAGMRPVLASLSIALYAMRLALKHRARLRAAKYVVGLFATHTAVRDAAIDVDRWNAGRIGKLCTLCIVLTALPMATLLYVVRGRKAARTSVALLVAGGTICWGAPFAGALLMWTGLGYFGCLLAFLIWVGMLRIGEFGAFELDRSIKMILRVGGPELRTALDNAGFDQSPWT
jgi:hypothetical protein